MKLELPGESTLRLIAGGVLLALVGVAAFLIWRAGRNGAEFKNVQAQVRTTEASNTITRETADTVAQDQAETQKQARADEGVIRERIDAQPRAAGPADADILRVARAAHARALCAAGRVQRACSSDDPAGAAGD